MTCLHPSTANLHHPMSHQFDNNYSSPVHVDYRNAPAEQRKALSRMTRGAGKGDAPRNIYSDAFRRGWVRVFGKRASR